MVATTQVPFLVGANYGVDFKKISSPVKPGSGVFEVGRRFLLLNENRGAVLPPPA
jgi:hypothetical protein